MMVLSFLGVAVFIILLAVIRLVRYHTKTKKYYPVKGLVIDNEAKRTIAENATMHSTTYYSPVIQFIDKAGNKQTFVASQDNQERPLYAVGATVKLLVNEEDPSRFIFHDIVDGYIIPIVWIVIGIAVALVGMFYVNQ